MIQRIDAALPRIQGVLPGPRAAAIIARDRAVLSPSYTRTYPLVAARGEGAIIEDVDGNRFLDFNAGIAVAATGHSHPRVLAAVRAQTEKFLHYSGTDFYYENMVELAEKLDAIAPGSGPHRVYFGNSGTEAVEAAMKLARYHSGREKFIAFFGAFHGRTFGSLSLTGSKNVQKKGFGPMVPGVHHIPYPDSYRRPAGQTPEDYAAECVRAIEEKLIRHLVPAGEIAAVIVEPIQGEGGYVVPPQNFFDELQAVCRRHGILIIADEVQSGMGRTGKMWASNHFSFEPDIVAAAKGIASGMPLGATIARADIMNWQPGSHASTFGGNPVSIAASLATIELLEQELIANAAQVGDFLLSRMREWPRRFPIVGDVRGRGLMIGFELVKDQQTKERHAAARDRLVQMAFERGLLILGAGINAIRLCPPLVITKDQAGFALDTIEDCLKTLEA